MEKTQTYYVYDEKKKVKEIRTKVLGEKTLYVITKIIKDSGRLKYKSSFVDEALFYDK
jgi:hypothetical protein